MAERSYNQANCPIASALDVVGERWTLLIVRELLIGDPEPRRFGELIAKLPGLSRTLLTERLRALEAAGIVTPQTNGGARAINGWRLTEGGLALGPVVRAVGEWGIEHGGDYTPAQRELLRGRISSLG